MKSPASIPERFSLLALIPALILFQGCSAKNETEPPPPPDVAKWVELGGGMNGSVDALVVYQGALIAGGLFTTAGGTAANRIARWDGTSWSPLGTGMNADVRALAVHGDILIAGGTFTEAGGVPASRVAQWNGSSWSPLDAGVEGSWLLGLDTYVSALASYDGALYAGGNFVTAGTASANCIARWNGTQWAPVGLGLDPKDDLLVVEDLTVYQNALIAGGRFSVTDIESATTFNIARWNGAEWSALGMGIGRTNGVSALAASGNTLFAGGNFQQAGTADANSIARWDGSSWSALGAGVAPGNDGIAPDVFVLMGVNGSEAMVAGGLFTQAGDTTASKIARWDGTRWTPLGTGMGSAPTSAYVGALAVFQNQIIAGGNFIAAEGSPANGIARWDD